MGHSLVSFGLNDTLLNVPMKFLKVKISVKVYEYRKVYDIWYVILLYM